jgi:hypothetical protein
MLTELVVPWQDAPIPEKGPYTYALYPLEDCITNLGAAYLKQAGNHCYDNFILDKA